MLAGDAHQGGEIQCQSQIETDGWYRADMGKYWHGQVKDHGAK